MNKLDINGDYITKGMPEYGISKKIWNSDVKKQPLAIVKPRNNKDIREILEYAKQKNLKISIKNGGHGASGNSLIEDGLVIDLSYLKACYINDDEGSVIAQSGMLIHELNEYLRINAPDKGVPVGTCPFVGLAGLTLGGGIGFLSRKYGLTCDSVNYFTIITADGKTLKASQDENISLYRSLKGGGHCNFGVVVEISYKLHSVPAMVMGGTIAFPIKDAESVIQKYIKFMSCASDDTFLYCSINNDIKDTLSLQIYGYHLGSVNDAHNLFEVVRQWGDSFYDDIGTITYHEMLGSYEKHVPEYPSLKWKCGFLKKDFDLDFIGIFIALYNQRPNSHCRCHFDPLGGEISRIDASESSFENRLSPFLISILSIWYDESERDECILWATKIHSFMSRYFSSDGHANYDDSSLPSRSVSYFGESSNKILKQKNIFDPMQLFSGNLEKENPMKNDAVILVNPLGGMCEFREYSKNKDLKIISIYTPEENVLRTRMGQDVEKLIESDHLSIFSSDVNDVVKDLTALDFNFKAVVPCHECGVDICSQIGVKLGLTHNLVENMQAARDKRIMRKRAYDAGLSSPHFNIVNNINDIEEFLGEHPLPVVIKTPMGGGTSNIFVCRTKEEVFIGYEKIKNSDDLFGNKSSSAIIESYLEGKEIIVDGFSNGTNVTMIGVWEYHKISTDFGDNLYYNIISKDVNDPIYKDALEYTAKLVDIIGIDVGMFHCELKINEGVPTLIEIGARLPGWGIPELYRAASNFDPWEKTLEVFTQGSLNNEIEIKYHKDMAMAICPVDSEGYIKEICGLDKIKELKSYETHILKVNIGDYLSPTCELYDTPLEVCLANEDKAQLLKDVQFVHDTFELKLA